jgi:hypothetical protein
MLIVPSGAKKFPDNTVFGGSLTAADVRTALVEFLAAYEVLSEICFLRLFAFWKLSFWAVNSTEVLFTASFCPVCALTVLSRSKIEFHRYFFVVLNSISDTKYIISKRKNGPPYSGISKYFASPKPILLKRLYYYYLKISFYILMYQLLKSLLSNIFIRCLFLSSKPSSSEILQKLRAKENNRFLQ